MEIISTNTYSTYPLLYVTNGDVNCNFNAGSIFRAKKADEIVEQFRYLNWFFARALNDEERVKLYNAYKRAADILNSRHALLKPTDDEMNELRMQMPEDVDQLQDCMAEILEVCNIEKIFTWVTMPNVYKWPNQKDLPIEYSQASSPKYPANKTYLNREYKELFAMILQVRAIAPIWAGFLNIYSNLFSPIYRETFLVSMLEDTAFTESSPYQRLKVYIDAWVSGKGEIQASGVMHSMSEDVFPQWLLCYVIVKKLAIQSFKSPTEGDTSPFVVKHLSNIILELLKKSPTNFNNPTLKNTKKGSDGGPNDDTRSVFESNNIKQAVSSGERWTVQYWCGDFKRIVTTLDPNINYLEAKEVYDSFNSRKYIPSDEQLLLATWVTSTIISPRSEPDLTHDNCVNICAAATAYLWQRGHHQVACWLSSVQGSEVVGNGVITQGNVRHGKDKYAELEELYPYSEKPKSAGKTYTPIRDTVVNILTEAEKHEWYPQLPKPYLVEVRKSDPLNAVLRGDLSNPVMFVQQSLGSLIMNVVIELAKRDVPQSGWDKACEIATKMELPEKALPFESFVPKIRPLDF